MAEKVMIQVKGVKKQYRLGQVGSTTLQEDLQSRWARLRGKEDPNSILGQKKRRVGEKFLALNDINLTVYRGEALGIIGSNGAGKSTLLKLLSRITAPTEGTIDLYGRVSSMLEVGTGFNREMTGRENIYMSGAILGMTKKEIDSKMEAIIDFSEVREFIDTPVKRYSSGMFLKLAFSVAVHLNSEIMIMDEILAVGDAAFQEKCLEGMQKAATEKGRTVLYVSHNMNTIRRLCSRCIVMEEGKIIFDGDVEEAIHLYLSLAGAANEVDMDLASKPRRRRRVDDRLVMTHLTLLDKATPTYDPEEKLKMEYTVQVKEPLDGVQLRFTLRSDTDQGIGTWWTKPMSFSSKGEYWVRVALPLHLIADGNYYTSIGFVKMGDAGRMISYDSIIHAFSFGVHSQKGIRGWSSFSYGNIRFPQEECTVLPVE